jgi:phosphate transport system permease protein
MSSLRRSSERTAARMQREAAMRRLARAGAWLLIAALAWPLLDLLGRAGAGGIEWATLLGGDSIEAVHAGLLGALRASLLAMLPVVLIATPLGLAVAVCLEEIAWPRRLGHAVRESIRHLAMLPPVVYGLLGFGGLVVVFGLPVGTPLLAGAVLGLAVLPRIVLAGQFALRRTPFAVREAGFAVGASPLQVVAAHVLPQAAPAMIGAAFTMLARALGEAAPLLLVGFAAFAAGMPRGIDEPGVPLPVLIFRWGEMPEPLFAAKAAAAALLLVTCVAVLGIAGRVLERRGRIA